MFFWTVGLVLLFGSRIDGEMPADVPRGRAAGMCRLSDFGENDGNVMVQSSTLDAVGDATVRLDGTATVVCKDGYIWTDDSTNEKTIKCVKGVDGGATWEDMPSCKVAAPTCPAVNWESNQSGDSPPDTPPHGSTSIEGQDFLIDEIGDLCPPWYNLVIVEGPGGNQLPVSDTAFLGGGCDGQDFTMLFSCEEIMGELTWTVTRHTTNAYFTVENVRCLDFGPSEC